MYPGGPEHARLTTDAAVQRVSGQNAYAVMWDDSLGPALQLALFDAVGQALAVPVHALLGQQVRDRVDLGWWATDLEPQDLASECQTAVERGYRYCLLVHTVAPSHKPGSRRSGRNGQPNVSVFDGGRLIKRSLHRPARRRGRWGWAGR